MEIHKNQREAEIRKKYLSLASHLVHPGDEAERDVEDHRVLLDVVRPEVQPKGGGGAGAGGGGDGGSSDEDGGSDGGGVRGDFIFDKLSFTRVRASHELGGFRRALVTHYFYRQTKTNTGKLSGPVPSGFSW